MDFQSNSLTPKVVLGVAAHPDDLDFGASATLAKYAQAGAEVYYLILTDGSKGSDDHQIAPEELIKLRREEQRAALLAIRGRSVTFLNYPDSALEVSIELKRDIVREIRLRKPDIVITNDPTLVYSRSRGYINHPDHRAAGLATLDAIFPLARDHLTFPELLSEGLMPHKTKTVLLNNFDYQNYYEDVSNTLELKWQVLKCHASQIKDFAAVRERFTHFAELNGKKAGCKYAEGFIRLDVG